MPGSMDSECCGYSLQSCRGAGGIPYVSAIAPQMATEQVGAVNGSEEKAMIKIIAVGKIKEKALRAQIE